MRQNGGNDCHPFFLGNDHFIVWNLVGDSDCSHFFVLAIDKKRLLISPSIIDNFECGGEFCIGCFWIAVVLINLTAEVEWYVIIERQCDILVPWEGVRIDLLILFLISHIIFFISDCYLSDPDRNDFFIELYSYAFYD